MCSHRVCDGVHLNESRSLAAVHSINIRSIQLIWLCRVAFQWNCLYVNQSVNDSFPPIDWMWVTRPLISRRFIFKWTLLTRSMRLVPSHVPFHRRHVWLRTAIDFKITYFITKMPSIKSEEPRCAASVYECITVSLQSMDLLFPMPMCYHYHAPIDVRMAELWITHEAEWRDNFVKSFAQWKIVFIAANHAAMPEIGRRWIAWDVTLHYGNYISQKVAEAQAMMSMSAWKPELSPSSSSV